MFLQQASYTPSFGGLGLRDKIDLHGRHPDLVASLGLPRSREMAAALDFFSRLRIKGVSDRPYRTGL